MRSKKQIQASRINGAKSRGPKTPEGKAIASRNSLRHGQTAKAIVLGIEDPARYTALVESFFEKFQPADEVERCLVEEMAIARWRMQRDWTTETSLLELELDRQYKDVQANYTKIDPACQYALAFKGLADNSQSLHLNARYEANHRRAFYRAFKGLMELRQMMNDMPPAEDPVPEPEKIEPDSPEPKENKSSETNPGTTEPPPIHEPDQPLGIRVDPCSSVANDKETRPQP